MKMFVKKLFLVLLLSSILNGQYLRDDSENIVFDTATRLVWADPEDSVAKNTKDALAYCKDLEIGFYKNWRLPSYNELYSLVDLTKSNPTLNDIFQERSLFFYWTSTTYVDGFLWAIDFRDGGNTYSSSPVNLNKVRCVHDF
jgi:hypothetical protein